MGLLRILLALSVFLTHVTPFWNIVLLNGEIAVYSFFIISGFYMALILKEKYTGKGSTKIFLTNRFLRIYPTYWVVLLFFIIFALIKYFFFHGQGEQSVISNYLFYFSKMPPFSDAIAALNYFGRNLTFLFTIDYFYIFKNEPSAFLVQPAWTLQIELFFYLLAPFLVKRSTLFLVISAVLARVLFQIIPLPLSKTFLCVFAGSLLFFVAGIISYRFMISLKKKYLLKKKLLIVFVIFILITLSFDYLNLWTNFSVWLYYLAVALAIPFIFKLTQKNRFDRFLGNLSYPFYISHFFIVKLLNNTLLKNNNVLFALTALSLSILVSVVLYLKIEKPIDACRQVKVKLLR
jgi:peptidoglycan/LPS O-acetylase OafA/YrhL